MKKNTYTVLAVAESTLHTLGRMTTVFARRNIRLSFLTVKEIPEKNSEVYMMSFDSDTFTVHNIVKQLQKQVEVQSVWLLSSVCTIDEVFRLYDTVFCGTYSQLIKENI